MESNPMGLAPPSRAVASSSPRRWGPRDPAHGTWATWARGGRLSGEYQRHLLGPPEREGRGGEKGRGHGACLTLGQRAPGEMGEDRPQDTGMPPGRGVEAEVPDTVGRGALAPTSGPQMGQDPRDTVTAQPRCPCRDRGLAATRARASWGERGAPHSLLGRLVLDVRGPVYFGAQVGPGRQICVFQGTCDIFIGGASEEA